MIGMRFIQRASLGVVIGVFLAGQGRGQGNPARSPAPHALTAEEAAARRNRMVDEEIVAAGVKNPRVVAAMRATPRHEFVPAPLRQNAYYDMALPIGEKQTISPPFIVAFMTESIDPQPNDKVLEIGTGSGYQAAVLSGLVREVYTIEIVKPLGERAAKVLKSLKYENVHVKVGDGYLGWPENAPFDKIIVTCSPEQVPQALVDQLKDGGRMVIPVGERYQQTLYLLKKSGGKMLRESLLPVIFVPMTGEAEEKREKKPDPKNPTILNGDFEELASDSTPGAAPRVTGWHYQRQMEVVEDKDAPSGKHYIRFRNEQAGRGAQALQVFAVDGRYVHELDISLRVRPTNVANDPALPRQPLLEVQFYDENRTTIGDQTPGNVHGTSGWKTETLKIMVPVRAREGLIRIGMFGGTGELSLDDLKMKGQP
jgi:protein-L-isoaspartate(D-aspartate) O-methyltransferase